MEEIGAGSGEARTISTFQREADLLKRVESPTAVGELAKSLGKRKLCNCTFRNRGFTHVTLPKGINQRRESDGPNSRSS